MLYIPVIGLEIHVQLKTKSKMFCGCSNQGEYEPPNTAICPICTGHPGTLPVLNKEALLFGLRAAKALNCKIPNQAKFDRKNYFYPDLPKGYQISMYDMPIGTEGFLEFEVIGAKKSERDRARIEIERVHLEEDAAKNLHAPDGSSTLVDFNRAGSPLIEIVTKPDLRTPNEAKIFLQELRAIMRAIRVSDADMEKGHLRCDANISIRRCNDDGSVIDLTLNPKVEVKNINSFKSVERALLYEIQRQTKLYESGDVLKYDATRGWNDARGSTEEQRTKEGSADYRYFPEPDIPPLDLASLRDEVPVFELPAARRLRFVEEFGFPPADARIMVDDHDLADYAEEVVSELKEWLAALPEADGTADEIYEKHKAKLARTVSGWLLSKLGGLMSEHHVSMKNLKIDPENFAEFITLVYGNKLSSAAAMTVLTDMLLLGKDPSQIMEDRNLGQVEDADALTPVVERVMAHNPNIVAEIKDGKLQALKVLLGIVMKETEGRANPQLAEKMLKKKIAL